jgi:hypothetical protein
VSQRSPAAEEEFDSPTIASASAAPPAAAAHAPRPKPHMHVSPLFASSPAPAAALAADAASLSSLSDDDDGGDFNTPALRASPEAISSAASASATRVGDDDDEEFDTIAPVSEPVAPRAEPVLVPSFDETALLSASTAAPAFGKLVSILKAGHRSDESSPPAQAQPASASSSKAAATSPAGSSENAEAAEESSVASPSESIPPVNSSYLGPATIPEEAEALSASAADETTALAHAKQDKPAKKGINRVRFQVEEKGPVVSDGPDDKSVFSNVSVRDRMRLLEMKARKR